MPEFKDSKGERWQVTITGGTVKRCLDLLQVDIGEPLQGDPPLLTRFDLDIAFKVDLIYVVCKPQADERSLSDVEFAERLEGDALFHASEAFTGAWELFFQQLHRPHSQAAVEKQRAHIKRVFEAGAELVRSEALDAKLDDDLAELGSSFASSLQSPDATRSPERSGN